MAAVFSTTSRAAKLSVPTGGPSIGATEVGIAPGNVGAIPRSGSAALTGRLGGIVWLWFAHAGVDTGACAAGGPGSPATLPGSGTADSTGAGGTNECAVSRRATLPGNGTADSTGAGGTNECAVNRRATLPGNGTADSTGAGGCIEAAFDRARSLGWGGADNAGG